MTYAHLIYTADICIQAINEDENISEFKKSVMAENAAGFRTLAESMTLEQAYNGYEIDLTK